MEKIRKHLFKKIKILFLIFICLLIVLGCSTIIFALDPNKALTQYSFDQWQDELPQNTVAAITQTRDGYMWFGTYEGLARFDGVSFYQFNRYNTTGIISNAILTLYEDSKANLWIGTSGGVVCFKDKKFTTYTVREGLIHNVVRAIAEDNQGNMWFGTEKGVSCFKEGKFIEHNIKNIISNSRTNAICQGKKGDFWFGTEKGLILLKDNLVTIYTTKEGLTSNNIFSMCLDRSGNLWVGTTGRGLNCFKDGKFIEYASKALFLDERIEKIIQDEQENLWVATTTSGAYRLKGNEFSQLTTKEGLTHDQVRCLYEDREGNIWIGTNSGLTRLKDSPFTNYSIKEGLLSDNVRSVCESKTGGMWFGTDGGGLNFFKDGKNTVYTTKEGLPNTFIRCLYEDNEGNLWVGTTSGLSVFKNGIFTDYTRANFFNLAVNAVIVDKRGNLWVGTSNDGLFCFKDDKVDVYTIKDNLSNNSIRSVYEDKEGNIWIGTRTGINIFKGGQLINYSASNNIINGFSIFTFYQDIEATLWIGTERGLFWLKQGNLYSCTKQQGLFDDVVFQILESSDKNFWMSCNKGIYKVTKNDLINYEKGIIKSINCVSYNKLDGMPTNQCNGATQPAGWKDKEGKLWFPTIKGITVIDPENIKINKLPPPVIIEQMVVDSENINLREKVKLEPGKKDFEFYYNGLSFVAPKKVRFKYKLEGYDADWKEVTRRTAYYTNLAPGDYKFRVIACNNDGIWNEVGASYSFHINTPVLQTWWAYLFYATGTGGILYIGFLLRVQALKRQNRRLETKVENRTLQLNKKNDELAEKAGELNKKNDELAEKINELHEIVERLRISEETALEAKNKAVESEKKALEANQSKSVFLSNMSHELRTPLNAIMGFAQLMERDKTLNNKQVENLGIILRSGEHLLGLINDVLSLAKIEAGKITLSEQTFNLSRLLQAVEEMIKVRTRSKGLDLYFELSELPENVLGDEGKLRQILINLLGNAVKFTDKGKVVLRAKWNDGIASFEVEDTGQGIGEDEIGNLFQAFAQTQSGYKSKEGTGLGLALSKNFINLMDGDISLKSQLNKGTTFTFYIKLPKSTEAEVGTEKRKIIGLAPNQPQYRILAIDDKLENRRLLVELFQPLGFQIREASNGEEAIELWRSWHPNLIWMDMRMPIMDGYLATKHIRQAEEAKNNGYVRTIIIALTASAFEHEQQAILDAGCDDFVTKPFPESVIFDKLAQHLGIKYHYQEYISKLAEINKVGTVEPILTNARFKRLPNELLEELTNSLNIGDNQAAEFIVEQIIDLDQELANEIRKMVKNFQFDELLELMEGAKA